ncbi:hypothetical protein ACNQVK_03225 [Mycobacterium sp. 134]|uniref:magnesium chelatase subunit ChlI family protein n=1 Tax=Mycobacterium sp. 134 TaxID=3400425 RepID=UPI003AAA35A6
MIADGAAGPASASAGNAQVPGSLLREVPAIRSAAMEPMRTALELGSISVSGCRSPLAVAWTVADLAGLDLAIVGRCAGRRCSFRQGGVAR